MVPASAMLVHIYAGKAKIFISGFKLKDFFTINKQVAAIRITMQTQTKCCVCFNKINTKRFSDEPKLPIMPKV